MLATTIPKVFVHGTATIFLQLALAIFLVWVVLGPFRVVLFVSGANVVVFVLGLFSLGAIDVVITGSVNSWLVGRLWFPVRKDLLSFLVQGVAIHTVALVILTVPLVILVALAVLLAWVESLAFFVAVLVLESFVYGLAGREIGRPWRIERPRPITPRPPIGPHNPSGLHCPHCGGVQLIVAEDQSAYCIDCERGITKAAVTATRA